MMKMIMMMHLQTHFWHCDIVIRYCDIPMPFVSQNNRDFPRVMSFVPELCQSSHNTSHKYELQFDLACDVGLKYSPRQLFRFKIKPPT
jgi:hypothetical protein